jgi:hypothetical protein
MACVHLVSTRALSSFHGAHSSEINRKSAELQKLQQVDNGAISPSPSACESCRARTHLFCEGNLLNTAADHTRARELACRAHSVSPAAVTDQPQ